MKEFNLLDKALLLKDSLLFHELDLDLLLAIAYKMDLLHYTKDQFIFSEGQEALSIYLIVQGKISILNANLHPITNLKTGDFFGDESIFNQKKRAYSAKSHSTSILLSLGSHDLFEIIKECPQIAIKLLNNYTDNLSFRQVIP